MNLFEALRIAFGGLLANRLRSALTMLGILIGVSAVILLVAVGNGASVQINNQIQSLGANVIYVYPSNAKGAGGVSQGFGTSQTADHGRRRRAQQPASRTRTWSPPSRLRRAAARSLTETRTTSHRPRARPPRFRSVRDYQIAEGSFFTDDDVLAQHRVVVIGQTVVDNLFGRPTRSARRSRSAARASA